MKVAVVGLGQIGASLCAALKRFGIADSVVGADTDPGAVGYCVSNGLIDEGFSSASEVPPGTDIVVLAVPVERMGEVAGSLIAAPGTVLTDVGSVKESVERDVTAALADGVAFVPAHPIAGNETAGAQNASSGIFEGKPVIITGGSGSALASVEKMWKKTGAKVVKMSADEHDRVFALMSHLPHVCAYLLASVAAEAGRPGLSGGGLNDTTRIALSDPALWAGILLENSSNVLAALDRFSGSLADVVRAIENGDRERLTEILSLSRDAKTAFMKK